MKHPTESLPPLSIVVGSVEADPESEAALSEGLETAGRLGARMHVVEVLEAHRPDRTPEELARRARTALGTLARLAAHVDLDADVDVTVHVRTGDPAEQILDVAEGHDAELVIVGATHGRIGRTANRILDAGCCSVRVVASARRWPARPPGDATSDREVHVYETTRRIRFSRHNSDTAGPTAIAMIDRSPS